MRGLYIVGCGGFGREVVDVVDAINAETPTWDILGLVDDRPSTADQERAAALGLTLVNGVDHLLEQTPGNAVIGIGSGSVRRAIDRRLSGAGWQAPVLVHPTVTMGREVHLGAGTILCAGVRLTTNIRIGRHVHVNLNSTIGHDCEIRDYVSVNPLVAVSGNVVLGEGVSLGTHSAILQNLEIGSDSTVGAGALVVKDVPSGIVVKGVPAR